MIKTFSNCSGNEKASFLHTNSRSVAVLNFRQEGNGETAPVAPITVLTHRKESCLLSMIKDSKAGGKLKAKLSLSGFS